MKIRSNIAILIAGSLTATTPLFAKNGFDDGPIPSSASGTAGTSGAAGTSGTAGTLGTAGTSGAAGTSGTAGTSGDIEPRKKVVASFGDKLIAIPCIDVRDSPFDGRYHVVMKLAGNGSGFDWKLKRAEVTTDPACYNAFDDDIDSDDVLAAGGMPSTSELSGTSGTAGTAGRAPVIDDSDLRKKVRVSFADNLLVIPCVDVQTSVFAGIYDVVMQASPNNIEEWHVKLAKSTTCNGEPTGAVNLNDVLRSMDMPTAAELNKQ